MGGNCRGRVSEAEKAKRLLQKNGGKGPIEILVARLNRQASEDGNLHNVPQQFNQPPSQLPKDQLPYEHTPILDEEEDYNAPSDGEDCSDTEDASRDFDYSAEEEKKNGRTEKDPTPMYIENLCSQVQRDFESKTGFYLSFMKGQRWIRKNCPIQTIHVCESEITPESFYEKDLFVWDPKTAFGNYNFHCVDPNCVKNVLKYDGWPTTPVARRVYSLGETYFVQARRYKCDCGKRFLSTSSEFLQGLPIHIQDSFPCQLTHRAGMDKKLLNFIFGLISEGCAPTKCRSVIKEIYFLNYDKLRVQYYVQAYNLVMGKIADVRLTKGRLNAQVLQFSKFAENGEYHERVPSLKFVTKVFKIKHDLLRDWYDGMVSSLSCSRAKIDHSFKVIKRIRLNGAKIFGGLFTVLNQSNQIRQQSFVFSKSLNEVTPILQKMEQTLISRGLGKIQSVSTDLTQLRSFLF
jgi:hypothetical protein